MPRSPLKRTLALAAALALPLFAAAQQPPPPIDGPPPPPMLSIPQQLAGLADQPATHTSFTFDRSMLESAQGMIGNDADARRIVAGLSSITVDTYRFQQPAFYAPEAMSSIVATFDANGWKHLVNAHGGAGQSAQPTRTMTDLWLHFRGSNIDDVAVLSRGSRTMNLVQVSGNLRPLDLLHLSGHFGIPKVDPDAVMVPAPPGR